MWPGVDSRIRRHMWVEFVGSLLCSERFLHSHQKPDYLICVESCYEKIRFCTVNLESYRKTDSSNLPYNVVEVSCFHIDFI